MASPMKKNIFTALTSLLLKSRLWWRWPKPVGSAEAVARVGLAPLSSFSSCEGASVQIWNEVLLQNWDASLFGWKRMPCALPYVLVNGTVVRLSLELTDIGPRIMILVIPLGSRKVPFLATLVIF